MDKSQNSGEKSSARNMCSREFEPWTVLVGDVYDRDVLVQDSSAGYISRCNVNTNTGASYTFKHSSSLVPFLSQAIPPHNRCTDRDYR